MTAFFVEVSMEYVKRKLLDIHPYENNPRIIDGAVDDVAESIRQCSYIIEQIRRGENRCFCRMSHLIIFHIRSRRN